ncbi:MAG TPA: c-type cytochrome biogenesis protein CcsB [Candidatus Binataceae bacterium]|nr:c-type cytochrome biogenesis protein CcsB [Candidatus Binataceae bacterium]
MNLLFLIPALVAYAASSAGFIFDRATGRYQFGGYATAAMAIGAVLQAFNLAARGIQAGNIPVGDLAQSVAFLSWITALAAIVLMTRFRMIVIGAFVGPAVLFATLMSWLAMGEAHIVLPQSLQSVWLPIHVTLALAGYAMFVLAAAVSFVYLARESKLKSKRSIGPPDVDAPSLEKLDRINYRLLGWGFLMLSLAIVSGAIWADAQWGRFWSWEPKESWSLVIWILYAGLLESRLTVGWRGRRAATLTIVVFTVLISSFIGVSFVFPGKHGGNFG